MEWRFWRWKGVGSLAGNWAGVDTLRYVAYIKRVIQGFANIETKRFFEDGVCPAKWRVFETVAARKLDMLDAATSLDDLKSPPGNRLEALKGDRAKQHSIRVNDKWRLCFIWTDRGPDRAEIADYH